MIKRHAVEYVQIPAGFRLARLGCLCQLAPKTGRGLQEVWHNHVVLGKPIAGYYLLAAFGLYLVSLLVTLFRWYILVRQDLPFTVPGAMRIGLIGFFYNSVLPGSVGGDIIKAAAIVREQSRRTVAVATVIMDRVIALWGLVWFVAVFGCLSWSLGWLDGPEIRPALVIVVSASAIVAVSIVVWLLLGLLPQSRADRFAGRLSRIPRVGGAAAEFWCAVWMYRLRQQSVALALVLSWIGHVGFVLSFYCSAVTLWDGQASNPLPTVTQYFLIVPIGMVISAMPLFPGGAGIGEAGFGGLFRLFGSAPANGILGSLVQRIIAWVIGLSGYLILLSARWGQPVPNGKPAALNETSSAKQGIQTALPWQPAHPPGVAAR